MQHWSPALKKQWQQAMVSLAPHVETVKSKAIEGYEVSRDTIKPHLVKAHESLSPHVQVRLFFMTRTVDLFLME